MDSLKFSLLMVICCLAAATAITTRCAKPDFDAEESENSHCCSVAPPNLGLYQKQCQDYRTSALFPAVKVSPNKDFINACYYSCAWNVTGIMPDEKTVIMDRMMKFFNAIFNDDSITTDLRQHAKECAENYFEILLDWQKNGNILYVDDFRPRFGIHCSWAPLVISACVEKKLITLCSPGRWRNTKTCNAFQKYLNECLATPVSKNPNGLTIVEHQHQETEAIVE